LAFYFNCRGGFLAAGFGAAPGSGWRESSRGLTAMQYFDPAGPYMGQKLTSFSSGLGNGASISFLMTRCNHHAI
jgi:hypothetical protein